MSNELSKYINLLQTTYSTILLIFQEHYFAWNLRFLLSHAALKHTTLIVVAAPEQFVSPCVLKVLPSSISFKVIRRSLWEVTASYETHTVIFIKKFGGIFNFFLEITELPKRKKKKKKLCNIIVIWRYW